MDGTELACRFSFITNSLRLCGPEAAASQFVSYIKKESGPESVRDSIMKFEGLYPYLSAIAKKNKMDFLDYKVVEAYWIGNELLDNIGKEDIIKTIKSLTQRGLPKSHGSRLIKELPDGMALHHNFNVIYVGVGRTSGSVPTTLQNMNNCMISSGRIVGLSGDNLIVSTSLLEFNDGKYLLKNNETKTAAYSNDFMPEVKLGMNVALHWGFACDILTEAQVKNLKKYTDKIIAAINNNNSQ